MITEGRKPIMFDRSLQPEWFDFALALVCSVQQESQRRVALTEYLRPRLKGAVTLEKTVRQLLRALGAKSKIAAATLARTLAEMRALSPPDREPVRLRLLLASNEFVFDCAMVAVRIHALGTDGITMAQLTERISDAYGHRGTVPRRVRHVLQMLRAFGGLTHGGHRWCPTSTLVVALEDSTLRDTRP